MVEKAAIQAMWFSFNIEADKIKKASPRAKIGILWRRKPTVGQNYDVDGGSKKYTLTARLAFVPYST